MLYLNEQHLRSIGVNWKEMTELIRQACLALAHNDYAQPVKPYLRYRNRVNRIIAMPAFVGGEINKAGIKWIASFPGNIENGNPRAHSVTILNDASTGAPVCIINTAHISGIRTAAVSGFVLGEWLKKRSNSKFKVGMTGFGPIGKLHLDMLFSLLGDRLGTVNIYELRNIDDAEIGEMYKGRVHICNSFAEAYDAADIFLTCTVSSAPYIETAPKKGSLHLNVSLRDYKSSWRQYADVIIVDNWEEVCRENTDIELMHVNQGLQKEEVYTICDLAEQDLFATVPENNVVMFNPMGMAVFDIATGSFFYNQAVQNAAGVVL